MYTILVTRRGGKILRLLLADFMKCESVIVKIRDINRTLICVITDVPYRLASLCGLKRKQAKTSYEDVISPSLIFRRNLPPTCSGCKVLV